jgi:hypothetical protein
LNHQSQEKGDSIMRPLFIAATMLLALATAPAIAKPTTAVTAPNLRAVLAPQVDLNFGTPNWREPPLELAQTATPPARAQTIQIAPGQARPGTTGARP